MRLFTVSRPKNIIPIGSALNNGDTVEYYRECFKPSSIEKYVWVKPIGGGAHQSELIQRDYLKEIVK